MNTDCSSKPNSSHAECEREDLQNEIAAWETASDEDFLNFEREIFESE